MQMFCGKRDDNVSKFFKKIRDRIRRFFCPTINEALWQYGIGESLPHSKKELERLKELIEEYEKKISSK